MTALLSSERLSAELPSTAGVQSQEPPMVHRRVGGN